MLSRAHLCLLVALLASAPVAADEITRFPSLSIYGGGSVGANLNLGDWDLGDHVDGSVKPGSSFLLALRGGAHLHPQLAVEAALALLPVGADPSGSSVVLDWRVAGLYHFLPGRWSPFAVVGFGGYSSTGGDLGGDTDVEIDLGVGGRMMILPWLAARVEIRDVISDGFDGLTGNNLEITVGVDVFAWRQKHGDRDRDGVMDEDDRCPDLAGSKGAGGCPDGDSDGIADGEDACPTISGVRSAKGCPDQDGDGVADAEDACPAAAGPAMTRGCPDGDKDGITDAEDACPATPGPLALKGCPDQDNDGIADAEDTCPTVPGPLPTHGCPDQDGDGIADGVDKCPAQPGTQFLGGCPDQDQDGIADPDDKCPTQAGVPEEQGCLPKAVEERFTGSIKGITFATGSAQINPTSFALLDETVALLQKYPGLRLRVEGHTDNVGKPEKNLKLSQDRAAAVRAYLESKGIPADRLEGEGFGDTRPKADNKTPDGRAQNRRIEFSILGGQK